MKEKKITALNLRKAWALEYCPQKNIKPSKESASPTIQEHYHYLGWPL